MNSAENKPIVRVAAASSACCPCGPECPCGPDCPCEPDAPEAESTALDV